LTTEVKEESDKNGSTTVRQDDVCPTDNLENRDTSLDMRPALLL